ncbi:MAG TPA: ZIP family metal transporter [Ideonella sp.]|uniref:ZIP family metal transporter n=1 Tax=Ideonella sp. TaxID=1929293 RepID=UPI002C349B51|nr:ZIP family metal transporter [Ideonella sp.]HSI49460.1 ZIP family metal transporter [Ideonella sp.]
MARASQPGEAAPPVALPWRRLLGFGIVLLGAVVGLADLLRQLAPSGSLAAAALMAGGMAALATALGTLPMLLSQRFSARSFGMMMGFGAGVMLAACAFSLIVPALAHLRRLGAPSLSAGTTVGLAMLLGAALVHLADRLLPDVHFLHDEHGHADPALRRTWLFVLAILLHNVPEGLSIGVAFAGSDALGAKALATGISIQDIPEGLVVSLALLAAGYGRWPAALIGAASGLVEPLAALIGVLVMGLSASLLPWGLAGAAGAMLYVICHEVIPESHREGRQAAASASFMAGFVLMMFLDTTLG